MFRPIGFNARHGRGHDYSYLGTEFSVLADSTSYDFYHLCSPDYQDQNFGEGVGDLCEEEDGRGDGYYTVSNHL